MAQGNSSPEVEIEIAPRCMVATTWFRHWTVGFHPDGLPVPWPRRVTRGGTRVQWTDAFNVPRTGALAHNEPPGPIYTPFQVVVRDYDGLREQVPASRVFLEGDPKATPCARCHGRPPAGFICGTCGDRGGPG